MPVLIDKAGKILSYWMGCYIIENVWNLWKKCCLNLGPEARVGPVPSPLTPAGLAPPHQCWLHAGPWSQGNTYKRKKKSCILTSKILIIFFLCCLLETPNISFLSSCWEPCSQHHSSWHRPNAVLQGNFIWSAWEEGGMFPELFLNHSCLKLFRNLEY